MKDIKETTDYITSNYNVVRDLIIINLPTSEELDALNTTKSGLIKSFGKKEEKKEPEHNQYLYTVIACGPDVNTVVPGDKIHIKPPVDAFMVEDFAIGMIGKFQVIMVKK